MLCLFPRFDSFSMFYPALIGSCGLYVATLALGNSLSLHHPANAKADFPRVKMLSAVGWIAGLAASEGRSRPRRYHPVTDCVRLSPEAHGGVARPTRTLSTHAHLSPAV